MVKSVARLSVEPVNQTIGAFVSGVDLSQELDKHTIAEIRGALVTHKVIFFRDQKLTTSQHLAFGRRFGALERHPFQEHLKRAVTHIPEHPDVVVLESRRGEVAVAEEWHSDVTWRVRPSLGSILRITDVPESGGDTQWADMTSAYESLDSATQSRLSELTAEHDWHIFRGEISRRGLSDDLLATLKKEFPVVQHPVVRTHPQSGRKGIYVNATFTTRISGMKESESRPLLRRLYKLADDPQLQVRLRWQPGTIAFWDNRSTQHRVVPDVVGYRRMERVTIAGDKPF